MDIIDEMISQMNGADNTLHRLIVHLHDITTTLDSHWERPQTDIESSLIEEMRVIERGLEQHQRFLAMVTVEYVEKLRRPAIRRIGEN